MNESLPNCPTCHSSECVEYIGDGFFYCDSVGCPDEHFQIPTPTVEPVQYRTLSPRFLELMEEIGQYGLSKYGERSTASRFAKGDYSRDERTKSRSFAEHANVHFNEYIDGIKHDKFNTREHQLAAAAFNAMLEYQFYKETL